MKGPSHALLLKFSPVNMLLWARVQTNMFIFGMNLDFQMVFQIVGFGRKWGTAMKILYPAAVVYFPESEPHPLLSFFLTFIRDFPHREPIKLFHSPSSSGGLLLASHLIQVLSSSSLQIKMSHRLTNVWDHIQALS
jgi:hypothetical protein